MGEQTELSDASFFVGSIQGYFEYITKKLNTFLIMIQSECVLTKLKIESLLKINQDMISSF